MASNAKHYSNGVDRISNLPESIRCHILSLLPTDDAVATCLLSTKWKSLWKNIHNLVFNDDSIRFRGYPPEVRKNKFAHFINMVLILLNEQSIIKFSLRLDGYCDLYDVTTWISAAVVKNVKVLEIDCGIADESDLGYNLPGCLYTCKTLEVLVLDGFMYLNEPNCVFLPKLKTLRLVCVIYKCDESFSKLISCCSSLETLYIDRSYDDNLVSVIVISPTLRNLTLSFRDERDSFPQDLHHRLVINAPQLSYLDLSDLLSKDFSFENLCSLDEAIVELSIDEYCSATVAKILQGVYNVKILNLKDNMHQLLGHVSAYPRFSRLTQLTVDVKCPNWNSLLNLVNGLNNLESLTFFKVREYRCMRGEIWIKPEKVPICLLSRLKTISITGLEDSEDELEVVAYILKHAKVLRKFTMRAAYYNNTEAKYKLLQKVSKFPRGSECELHFNDDDCLGSMAAFPFYL